MLDERLIFTDFATRRGVFRAACQVRRGHEDFKFGHRFHSVFNFAGCHEQNPTPQARISQLTSVLTNLDLARKSQVFGAFKGSFDGFRMIFSHVIDFERYIFN